MRIETILDHQKKTLRLLVMDGVQLRQGYIATTRRQFNIRHQKIRPDIHLNASKLHLNKKGYSIFAFNLTLPKPILDGERKLS